MPSQPALIVECKFKDFRATWRYVFNILSFMLHIPSIHSKLGPTNMAPMISKTWVLKPYVAWSRLFFLVLEWWVY